MGYFTWLWQDRQLRQLKDLNAQVASAVADLPDSGVTDQEWALLTALHPATNASPTAPRDRDGRPRIHWNGLPFHGSSSALA